MELTLREQIDMVTTALLDGFVVKPRLARAPTVAAALKVLGDGGRIRVSDPGESNSMLLVTVLP